MRGNRGADNTRTNDQDLMSIDSATHDRAAEDPAEPGGVIPRRPYRNELMICRYASSGNAFIDVVRTLPCLPSNSVKRAATASSGAS